MQLFWLAILLATPSEQIDTEVTSSWGTCCCGASLAVAATEPAICTGLVPAESLSTATHLRDTTALRFRTASLADAHKIWSLVRDSSILDTNSLYCYLLLCRDFADTCVVACRDSEIVGCVTAYRPPKRSDCIFVWQIGVAQCARRQGLAKRLLETLMSLPACREVQFLEATVTPSNTASRRLFRSFAEDLDVPCHVQQGFTTEMFGFGAHEQEDLFRIGPLADSHSESQTT